MQNVFAAIIYMKKGLERVACAYMTIQYSMLFKLVVTQRKVGSDLFIAHHISVETCFLIGCSIVWIPCVPTVEVEGQDSCLVFGL